MLHTHTLRDHKRDLLVIKSVHVAGVFTLELNRSGRESVVMGIDIKELKLFRSLAVKLFSVSRCIFSTNTTTQSTLPSSL